MIQKSSSNNNMNIEKDLTQTGCQSQECTEEKREKRSNSEKEDIN